MRRLVLLSLLAAATIQQPALSKDEFGEKHVRGEESFPQAFESLRRTSEPQKDGHIKTEDDPPLDIHKSDPAVHVALSKKYTKEKRYKEALIEVNRALLCNKDDWDAHFQGALILQLEGRTKEAIDRYRRYLVVKPENLQAHINLGVLLRKEGEMVEAEDEYKKAIELHYYSFATALQSRKSVHRNSQIRRRPQGTTRLRKVGTNKCLGTQQHGSCVPTA